MTDNLLNYFIVKYWKNGIAVNLTDGSRLADVRSIFVFEKDVYVAGYDWLTAKYWKNGIPNNLGSASTYYTNPTSIFILKQ